MAFVHFWICVCLAAVMVGIAFGKHDEYVRIWPMPANVENGNQTLSVSKAFDLHTVKNYRPSYWEASAIFKEGFFRMRNNINLHRIEKENKDHLLRGLRVMIESWDDELQFGTDESYMLQVPDHHNPNNVFLKAKTVYGALHGLETLSQLCIFNYMTKNVEIQNAPWTIVDQPRFSYRGLLIDTSRHFQTVESIKKVINAMAYSKLNVLHWHLVDTQSFPLEIPSLPKLWDGAYSLQERYTMDDARDIVGYAKTRGINVLAEIDAPGHAGSWGNGYPYLWPSADCQQPLDVSKESTFKVIDSILSDFSKVFKFKFQHMGGDEVNTSCWTRTPHIKKWLARKNFNESQAYKYFVLRAQKIALSHGFEPINWEETFNNFGGDLNPKTIVHNWLGPGVAPNITKAGFRCIVSNQDSWYLDWLHTNWTQFYINEPLTNITDPKQKALVIGGEVCMWGESVDPSDIEQTIWPRAAAAAERLWTPFHKLARDPRKVIYRLSNFRCLLHQRGVAAAPLHAQGRGTPPEPGSCYMQ